jgi:hypothetical protein
MKQDFYKYIVRFPEGMRDRIHAEAAANHRSINNEIVHRVAQSYQAQEKGAAEGATSPRRDISQCAISAVNGSVCAELESLSSLIMDLGKATS